MPRQRFRSGRVQGIVIVTGVMLFLMNVPTTGSAFGPDSELLI
jgi:hypothetical protein